MKQTLALCILLPLLVSCQKKNPWHRPDVSAAFEITVSVTPGGGILAAQAVRESYELLKERVEKLKIYYESIEPDEANQKIVFKLIGHSVDKEKEMYDAGHYANSLLAQSEVEFWSLYRLTDPAFGAAIQEADSLYNLSIPLSMNYNNFRSRGVIGVAAGPNVAVADSILAMEPVKTKLPPDVVFRWSHTDNDVTNTTGEAELYALKKETPAGAALNGERMKSVRVEVTPNSGEKVVSVDFDETGVKILADLTQKAYDDGRREIAIVLNGGVFSAPVVMSPILNGKVMISGHFTEQQAFDMATQLQLSMLKHELKVLEAKKL